MAANEAIRIHKEDKSMPSQRKHRHHRPTQSQRISLSKAEIKEIAQEVRTVLMPDIHRALSSANHKPRLWSLDRVLVHLGLDDKKPSRWTINRWLQEGKLPPAVETPAGKRWVAETVEAFAERIIKAS